MVKLRTALAGLILGGIAVGIIYFRNQIGQTGQAIGSGISGLAQGISDFGAGIGTSFASAGGGIGAGIAGALSPFGLTLPYQPQNYRPYNLYIYGPGSQDQNQPNNTGKAGGSSSGQDKTVTPDSRQFSDIAAQLQAVVATGQNLNQETVFSYLQQNPALGHAQRAQAAIQSTGGISPYEVFTTTVHLAREAGLGAADAFAMAKGTSVLTYAKSTGNVASPSRVNALTQQYGKLLSRPV